MMVHLLGAPGYQLSWRYTGCTPSRSTMVVDEEEHQFWWTRTSNQEEGKMAGTKIGDLTWR
jgi:hypothetical protein